jgi:hypothetical protein
VCFLFVAVVFSVLPVHVTSVFLVVSIRSETSTLGQICSVQQDATVQHCLGRGFALRSGDEIAT